MILINKSGSRLQIYIISFYRNIKDLNCTQGCNLSNCPKFSENGVFYCSYIFILKHRFPATLKSNSDCELSNNNSLRKGVSESAGIVTDIYLCVLKLAKLLRLGCFDLWYHLK